MKELVLHIEDTDYEILKEQAAAMQMTPEEYESKNLRNTLRRSPNTEKDFDQIIEYVVHKNAELYKRLA